MNAITVFKYTLPSMGGASLEMPDGAMILAVQNQRETVTLWASVDEKRPQRTRAFFVAMTGQPIKTKRNGDLKYLDSVQMADGDYVVHVFELL